MRPRTSPKPARRVFKGSLKWCVLLGILFAAFFSETWLQLQVYRNDYRSANLNREIKQIVQRIGLLQDKADELVTMERLNAKAPDLGLVQPNPQQIQVVFPPPAHQPGLTPQAPSYTIASLETETPTRRGPFGAPPR
jgi:hypothetical protein